jgi:hypothetical protein
MPRPVFQDRAVRMFAIIAAAIAVAMLAFVLR